MSTKMVVCQHVTGFSVQQPVQLVGMKLLDAEGWYLGFTSCTKEIPAWCLVAQDRLEIFTHWAGWVSACQGLFSYFR